MTYTSKWVNDGEWQTTTHDVTIIAPGEGRALIRSKLRLQAPPPPWESYDFDDLVEAVFAMKQTEGTALNKRAREREREIRIKERARPQ